MCFVFVFNLILYVTVFAGFDNYDDFVKQSEIRSMLILDSLLIVTTKKVGHLTFEKKNEINNKLINIGLLSKH